MGQTLVTLLVSKPYLGIVPTVGTPWKTSRFTSHSESRCIMWWNDTYPLMETMMVTTYSYGDEIAIQWSSKFQFRFNFPPWMGQASAPPKEEEWFDRGSVHSPHRPTKHQFLLGPKWRSISPWIITALCLSRAIVNAVMYNVLELRYCQKMGHHGEPIKVHKHTQIKTTQTGTVATKILSWCSHNTPLTSTLPFRNLTYLPKKIIPHNDLPLHNGDFPVRYELPKGNDDLGPYSPYYMRLWHAVMTCGYEL